MERRSVVRTKIVATLGPAVDEPERLAEVLEAGVDVCRLNFSHGTHDEHARRLAAVRAWAREHNEPTAVLGDLCGPKIRLNDVTDGAGELARGDSIRFVRGKQPCADGRFTVNYASLLDELQAGQRLFIDDGLVRLLVTEVSADEAVCTVTTGGRVSSHKGVNLPDTQLSTPALTEKDRRDLAWAIENELEFVALSFVRRPEDVRDLHEAIAELGGNPGVILKIEKPEALDTLDTLIEESDGIMVARGDMGVEMDVWRVPLIQKHIARRCREYGKPVIIATQMLQSMVSSPMPTRAEVSDIANAILDGTDAVMLSAETAVGEYPGLAVSIMDRVASETEAFQREQAWHPPSSHAERANPRVAALARGAVQAALEIGARAIVAWTQTGETVRLIARHRLPLCVVGLTDDERVCRRLNLLFGVRPLMAPSMPNPAEMVRRVDEMLLREGLVVAGDEIVVVTSTVPNRPGWTDTVLMRRVGPDETAGARGPAVVP